MHTDSFLMMQPDFESVKQSASFRWAANPPAGGGKSALEEIDEELLRVTVHVS